MRAKLEFPTFSRTRSPTKRTRRPSIEPWELLAVFTLAASACGWILAGADGILGVDGYYHFRVAEEIIARGPWVDISWLPFTVLGTEGPDHHWLFHLLLTPFTFIGHDLTAVQLAAVFFAASIPTALTWACRRLGVPYAPLFALLAFTSSAVLPGRYLMLRTHGLALIFMTLALLAMTKQRHLLLGLLAFFFMQFNHGAVMLVPLGALCLIVHRFTSNTFDSRIVVAVGSGLFLGLLFSPWFPDNVSYLVFHTVFKVGHAVMGLVGTEWYPTPWARLLQEPWPANMLLAAALAGVAGMIWRANSRKVISPETILFLLVALLFLVLHKRSWRFVDYYPPFACMAAGLVLRDLCRLWPIGAMTNAIAITGLSALLLCNGWRGEAAIERSSKMSPARYGEIGAYLNDHGQPGEVVLNTHWPDFVQLVWHSPQFNYVSGLDGHYLLYGDDAEQFEFWFDLRDLNTFAGKDIGKLAIRTFDARWMVMPAQNRTLAQLMRNSDYATQTLETSDGWLFELHRRDAALR